jgi:hypothetical protein
MGLSLEQMLAGSDGSTFGVTVVSNQDDGLVSYATGRLELTKGRFFIDPFRHSFPDTLSTINGEDLILLFSDRLSAGPETLGQPFDVDQPEKLRFKITPGFGSGQASVHFRVATWTDHYFHFALLPLSDLLAGIGPALSGNSPNAVFTFSFSQLPPSPR